LKNFILVVLCAASLSAAERPAMRVTPHAQTAPKSVTVDCTKGQKIQDAVDKNTAPLDILVHGICVEDVLVNGKEITLHGTDPLTDGVQGVTRSGLVLINVNLATLSNLGFVNGPAAGVSSYTSTVLMTNCRASGNAIGIAVRDDSVFEGHELTISTNVRGILADGARFASCLACRAENNSSWAGVSLRGSLFTYLDSEVIGPRGLQANNGYADIDCVSEETTHPCSLQVTGIAALAFAGGSAALYGAGDFTGRLLGSDRGNILLYGTRQTSPTNANGFDSFSTLEVADNIDVEPAEHSTLRGVFVSGFARALIRENSTLAGSIQCQSAADAFVDPSTTITPGNTVTGCDHASHP
jgi:hypothetical protein